VEDLSVEVPELDPIVVHDPERPDARRSQIEGRRTPEPTGAYQEDSGALQSPLSLGTHLGEDEMPRVANELGRAEQWLRHGRKAKTRLGPG
jgi:hypothetical protein